MNTRHEEERQARSPKESSVTSNPAEEPSGENDLFSDSVEVTLSVDETTGVVTADPDPARVFVDGQISWTSEQGAWAVQFVGPTPLSSSRRVRGERGERVGETARLPGRHKYFVVVQGEDGLLYTEDPDAEIKPR